MGGLLVIFSYFLAVCPNEMISKKWGVLSGVFFGSLLILILGVMVYLTPLSSVRMTELDIMYRTRNRSVLIFLVGALLVTLFSVVSIVRLRRGPLRPFIG